jgi:hypothetical protein
VTPTNTTSPIEFSLIELGARSPLKAFVIYGISLIPLSTSCTESSATGELCLTFEFTTGTTLTPFTGCPAHSLQHLQVDDESVLSKTTNERIKLAEASAASFSLRDAYNRNVGGGGSYLRF